MGKSLHAVQRGWQVGQRIFRVLGRKAKLECKYATAVDAHQLRNAEYRVSDPKNRENAWPQGYAEIQ